RRAPNGWRVMADAPTTDRVQALAARRSRPGHVARRSRAATVVVSVSTMVALVGNFAAAATPTKRRAAANAPTGSTTATAPLRRRRRPRRRPFRPEPADTAQALINGARGAAARHGLRRSPRARRRRAGAARRCARAPGAARGALESFPPVE